MSTEKYGREKGPAQIKAPHRTNIYGSHTKIRGRLACLPLHGVSLLQLKKLLSLENVLEILLSNFRCVPPEAETRDDEPTWSRGWTNLLLKLHFKNILVDVQRLQIVSYRYLTYTYIRQKHSRAKCRIGDHCLLSDIHQFLLPTVILPMCTKNNKNNVRNIISIQIWVLGSHNESRDGSYWSVQHDPEDVLWLFQSLPRHQQQFCMSQNRMLAPIVFFSLRQYTRQVYSLYIVCLVEETAHFLNSAGKSSEKTAIYIT